MKSNMKRFLGMLLATLMVVTMVPVTAFADDKTTGAPNVFSVVTNDSGDYMQTEFLLAETLTQNNQTYYGLMLRKGINTNYGGIRYPDIMNMDAIDDTTQKSTDTVKYIQLVMRNIKPNSSGTGNVGENGKPINSMITDLYPEEMLPYIATLEHKITDKDGVTYKTVDNITIPTAAQLIANKEYIKLQENASSASWSGTWSREKNTAYQPSYKWLKAVNASGGQSYGQMGSAYDYYFLIPIIYVTADFFENVKIDTTKEVGEDIKNLLAGKYYQRELKHLGYTADELTALGIKAQPDDATSILSWSPYYIKLEGADGAYSEFLYNGNTVEENGKTYIELIGAVDQLETSKATGFAVVSTTVGADGSALDSTKYWYKRVVQKDGRALDPQIDVNTMKDNLPTVFQNNIRLFDDQIPSFGHPAFTGYPAYLRQNMTYISFPSIDDFTNKHGSYLYSRIGQYQKRAVTSGKYDNFNFTVYEASNNSGVSQGGGASYAHGSMFPRFYVDMDVFKQVKMDVVSMGANVKAVLAANYSRSELSDVYTAAELNAIGVTDTPTNLKPKHSPNYVKLSNGTELLYNGVDGDYVSFMIANDYAGTSSYRGIYHAQDLEACDGSALPAKTYIEFYLTGSTWYTSSGKKLDDFITDLPTAMQDDVRVTQWNSVSSRYWAGNRKSAGDSDEAGAAVSLTKFTLPSGAEMTTHGQYLASKINDNAALISGNKQVTKNAAVVRDATGYSTKVYNLVDGVGTVVGSGNSTQYAQGSVFPVFYVNKNFLTEVKVDATSVGANVLSLFADYVKGDFTVDYTDAEFEALGVVDFKEEVKPATNSSKKIVVGGKTYILTGDTKEINGKNYLAVVSTEKYSSDWQHRRPNYHLVGDEFGTDNEVIFSTSYDNGERTDINAYADKFTPFDGYLMPSDSEWVLFDSVAQNTQLKTKIYYKGSIGIPTMPQLKAINAVEEDKLTMYSANDGGIMVHGLGQYTEPSGSFYYYYTRMSDEGKASNVGIGGTPTAVTGAQGGTWYFMTYIDPDFFKNTDINMATTGDGAKAILKDNFTRTDLTGWSKANLDTLFGNYRGEGLGLAAFKTANGAEVIVHNNGAEATGKGDVLVVASYDADGMIDVKTFVLTANISAGAKTSVIKIGVDVAGATEVKAMLWDSIINAKPLTDVVSVN